MVKPDDTVVIRIARSEMGQGTLTGLAQLVAEELECDWSKVTTEYPTPGQNLARNRVWGNFSTGGSRGIRESHDYVRKGGAAARADADPGGGERVERAGCRMPRRQQRDHARADRPHHDLRQGGRGRRARSSRRRTSRSRIRRTGRSPASRLKRLDTADKLTGKQVYGTDLKLPGMLNAAIKDCPVFGGKVKSFDAAAVQAHARREEGRAGRRHRGRGRRRHVVARQDRARCAADRVGRGPERQGVAAPSIAEWLKAGLDAKDAVVGNQNGDVRAGACRGGEEGRGGLLLSATRTTRRWSR